MTKKASIASVLFLLTFFFVCPPKLHAEELPVIENAPSLTTHRVALKYYPTGELRILHYYDKRTNLLDGPSRYYYKSGALYRSEEYDQAKLIGVRREFYEIGELLTEEHYKDGLLDGVRKEYYELEHVRREERWRDGKLISLEFFSFEGAVIYSGVFSKKGYLATDYDF